MIRFADDMGWEITYMVSDDNGWSDDLLSYYQTKYERNTMFKSEYVRKTESWANEI